MTISTTQINQKPICIKKSTPVKKLRGKDAIPFEEMERLMNLYGSIKALRNRGAPKKKGSAAGGGNEKKVTVKKDSIKRKFYRWFPNFEERFTKDENGHYQPIRGHEYEMKYRQEMRNKSVEDVTAKRSYSITRRNYEKKNKIVECQTDAKSGRVLSSEVSSKSNTCDIKIPDDNEIITTNIDVPSPTTTPSEINKDSVFFNNGNRAPSPLSFQQEPTSKAVSEDEEDTILSLVSQTSEEIAASELKNLNLSLFDEVDKHLMSMMQTYDPMPMMQSYGTMPMMNSYDSMPMMNAYDPMQMSSTMPSMLNSYPAMPLNTYESMPMNSECFSSRYSDDSLQGSMGGVSNGSSSSDDSSLYLDEHWGSDRDIEDCLLLGMGNEVVPTMTSLR